MAKVKIIQAWHNRLHSIISTLDHSSAATLGRILKADGNGLPIESANTDAELADAVAKRHTQGTDTALGAVGVKNPPIDADKSLYRDSTAGDALVTSTWAQIKAFLKTYFDTVYGAIGLAHARLHAITSTLDHSSAATLGKMLKADANGLPIEASNTDAEVASAVSLKHTQGTDVALGAVGTKNPPIDADKPLYRDSAAGDALVTSTWTQIKAFLKTYWDTLYEVLGSVATHAGLTTGVHGVGAGTVGIMNADKAIKDADADTAWEVEQSADEDKIHGKVNGVESFLLSSDGILTLAKQSGCHVYLIAATQSIPDNAVTKVNLETEVFDNQNEFNISTYKYTAKEPGLYIIVGQTRWGAPVADKRYAALIYKNSAALFSSSAHSSSTAALTSITIGVASLAANDVIELYAYHSSGASNNVQGSVTNFTYLVVAKIA